MDQGQATTGVGEQRRPRHFRAVLILGVAMFSSFAVAGCTHAPGDTAGMATMTPAVRTPTTGQAAGTVPQGSAQGMAMTPADASEAWAHRPSFAQGNGATEEAYAYALYNPQFIRYIPCYCGCGGMGHRSNLDCYYKKAIPGKPTQFEEHASFCDVCVRTTLTVKKLISEGKTLREIRDVVDRTFGGSTPGTPTELPPA